VLKLIFYLGPLISVGGGWLKSRNAGPDCGELCIEGNEPLLVGGDVFFRVNCIDRTFWDANRTVYTLIWVNNQKVWALSETVDGADVNTVGVSTLDAGFSNDVGHDVGFSPHNVNFPILADL